MDREHLALAESLGQCLQSKGLMLATAESCTGGWLAKTITDIAGSSQWFDCGFVTYSNQAKERLLGVSADTLAAQGAVSEATVREMVAGALARSRADWAVAISGIAGPGGGTPDKPVGFVCFAWGPRHALIRSCGLYLEGDREGIRRQAVLFALRQLQEYVLESS